MAERKRVALIYAYDETWIGGTYYVENLIKALSQLPDSEQPTLLVFSWQEDAAERLQKIIQYNHWELRRFERPLSVPERVLNKITAVLLKRRFIKPLYSDAEVVFPMLSVYREIFSRIPQHLYWIPDFQEHYLPQFFTSEEVAKRKADQQLIQQRTQHIVFSSQAARHDFNTIYPLNTLQQYVLQFAVTSQLDDEPVNACVARYNIESPYFICSNQFWKHKNHQIVLRALAELKQTHPQVLVLFTGKEHDYRNPAYFEELQALQAALDLTTEVRFLGFIPRQDQLHLMQGSIAVIQPSLFEGWSTVIEDAKSLNVPVIASNLAVHIEQLTAYDVKLYFDPANTQELRACMMQAIDEGMAKSNYNYQQNVINFARNFTKIINQVTAS